MLIETSPKSVKFKIIFNFQNKFKINNLCKILGVSLSGYYKHKKLIELNNTKEQREKYDLEIIRNEFQRFNSKHGYRMLTMDLKAKGIIINHKKVLRFMQKYGLKTKIRIKKPYVKIAKATQEHRTFANILNRQFRGLEVLKKIGTDITYLYYNGTKAYLSILKDMITGEIISLKVSSNLGINFVLDTIKDTRKLNLKGSIIHSDQGFHYTHPSYQRLLKERGIIQSMSRKGNCLDNAPTESFFGHLKDEIDLSNIKSFNELELYLENYIFYYNNKRPQWERKKMTPVQFRNHLLKI